MPSDRSSSRFAFPWNCLLTLTIALGVVPGTVRTDAHVGDVIYPFTEITDDMLEELDLTDGWVEDWEAVMGEPALNLLNFTRLEYTREQSIIEVPGAPSDLDLRVWLAWHRGTGRLFIGAQVSDDVYISGFEGGKNDYRSDYDSIGLSIDGDHSGGVYWKTSSHHQYDDYQQAQDYLAVAACPEGLHAGLNRNLATWMNHLPYAEGGGEARGENPAVYVVEFAVTPFDHLLWDDREQSVASDLSPGMIVGFNMVVVDMDTNPRDYKEFYSLFWSPEPSPSADRFGDGILLSAGEDRGGSVVESITWARIKAALQE